MWEIGVFTAFNVFSIGLIWQPESRCLLFFPLPCMGIYIKFGPSE